MCLLAGQSAGCLAPKYAKYEPAPDTGLAMADAARQAERAAAAANVKLAELEKVLNAAAEAGEPPPLTENRKIVYTAGLTLIVPDVTHAMETAVNMAKEMGGYLYRQSGNRVVFRIPAERFESAVNRFSGLGSVADKTITATDVTERYMDLDARLKNARILAERLRKLLANAAIKEAIEIERELARVQAEIDRLEGQLRLLKTQIAYATISLEFRSAVRELPAALKVKLPFAWLHGLGLDHLLTFPGGEVY
jgi:hypothetical protein